MVIADEKLSIHDTSNLNNAINLLPNSQFSVQAHSKKVNNQPKKVV